MQGRGQPRREAETWRGLGRRLRFVGAIQFLFLSFRFSEFIRIGASLHLRQPQAACLGVALAGGASRLGLDFTALLPWGAASMSSPRATSNHAAFFVLL
jgi:hypothetical protein